MTSFAVMVNSYVDKAHTSSAANAFQYALDLDDSGHKVEIYLDGAATQWVGTVERNNDHPVYKYYVEAQERDVLAGACEYCANAYDATEALEEAGVPLLGDASMGHGPDVGELVDAGYELLTLG